MYDDLTYIGYSQGTTQMFSALAENHGDLQNKINLFIALAPVAMFTFSQDGLVNILRYSVTNLNRALWSLEIEWIPGPDYFCNTTLIEYINPTACGQRTDIVKYSRNRWSDDIVPKEQ